LKEDRVDPKSLGEFDNIAGTPRDGVTGLFLPSAAVDQAQARVMAEIVALALERNAWELDALGYTVLTPEQTGAGDLVPQIRAHLKALFDAQLGYSLDLDGDERFAGGETPIGRGLLIPLPLLHDPMYEQALMNRVMLALVTYMLGESCILSSMSSMLKSRAPEALELHTDNVGMPAPMPPFAQIANATWALSDYTSENGATRFVPGSHKLARHPNTAEALDMSSAVTVTAPAGSIILWNGGTWHGAVPRTNPGARLSLIMLFCRWYLMPQILIRELVPAEALDRNPPRFATLMGKRSPYSGMDSDGSKLDFTLGQTSQFA
jgi:ectoine hydroxylase-related dioxygenase (phytanoyl-CoA dioxygenase family)